jgi:chromosome segregation ATPase
VTPFEAQELREEVAAATSNLAGLHGTLTRVEQEMESLNERIGRGRARFNKLSAVLFQANARNEGYEMDSLIGAPKELAAASRERERIMEAEGPLLIRQSQAEALRAKVRRAIALEEPRVAGLQQRVADLDAAEAAEQAEREREQSRPLAVSAVPIAGTADPEPQPGRLRDRFQRFAQMGG